MTTERVQHVANGGYYPFESIYSCRKCGDGDIQPDGDCIWQYNPSFSGGACDTCGYCDCSEESGAKAQQAMLCQVGECGGMAYHVYYNMVKGIAICENCYELLGGI